MHAGTLLCLPPTHDQVLYWMLTQALLTVVVVMTLPPEEMSISPALPPPMVAPELRVATIWWSKCVGMLVLRVRTRIREADGAEVGKSDQTACSACQCTVCSIH
jgi:hypothetical protein